MKKYMALMCMLAVANNSLHAMDPEANTFIEKHKDSPQELSQLLIAMAHWEKPDLQAARKVLDLGASVDAKDPGNIAQENPGYAALVSAAGRDHYDYVKFLLDNKANIEIKDPWDGRTALMNAALNGKERTAELLLQYKANPNATNCSLDSALTWACASACSTPSAKVVELLLAAHAEVNYRDNEARTPLFHARRAVSLLNYPEIYKDIAAQLERAGGKEYRYQVLINSQDEWVKIIDARETYAIPREARTTNDRLKEGWKLVPVATTQADALAIYDAFKKLDV